MSALRALASCSRPACVRCVPYSTRAVLKTQEHPRGEQDVAESSRNDPNERGPDGEAPRRAKMPISFLDKSKRTEAPEETLARIRRGELSGFEAPTLDAQRRRKAQREPRFQRGPGVSNTSLEPYEPSPRFSKHTPPVPGYVVAARYRTISKIQDVVSRWYEPRRVRRGQMYEVRAFGSTEYGADSPQSDLDLVIVDHSHPHGLLPHEDRKLMPEIYRIK